MIFRILLKFQDVNSFISYSLVLKPLFSGVLFSWKSSGCSLRKYIVLCTHVIVIECYSFSKIKKNSKNSYFFILFHFQHPHIVPKPYWYVLKMAFHIVFQVCFMFPEAETLEQAHSWVTRTWILENLQRPPNFSTFLIFQMKYFFWFQKFRK